MTVPSDWLETLGAATLNMLWMPLLAWSLVALSTMGLLSLRRADHAFVHYAARVALLLALPAGLLLAAATDFSFLALLPPVTAEEPGRFGVSFALPAALAPGEAASAPWTLYHGLSLLTLLAGLVALARLGRLAHHACALRRFRKHLPAGGPASLQQLVDDLAASLGLRRSVRAVVTTQEIVPMTSGWRLPLVIVPASLLDDAERLRLVLLHELIHVRRRDVLIHSVEQVMGALFVINPAVSLLRRSIRAYREMACDAEVLAQPHVSSKRYATLLYSFAAAPPTHRLLALSMASSEKHLKKRILAMKDVRSTPTHFPGTKGIAFALAGLLLGATTLIVACTDLTGPDADASALNKTEQEIFVVVEQMPELVGGLDALQGEMRYPRIARMAGISGRVIIQFTVDEEGRVVDPQVVKGLGAGCDEEALRVLQAATFKPGKQRGKPVAVKMSIPFMFKLDEEIEASVEAGPRPSMIINEFKVTSSLVTGRVLSSETQEGIAGVNILFEGSTLGATTDRDGYFKIRLSENTRQDAHLVVSHVSYQTAMLKLNSE